MRLHEFMALKPVEEHREEIRSLVDDDELYATFERYCATILGAAVHNGLIGAMTIDTRALKEILFRTFIEGYIVNSSRVRKQLSEL